MEELLVDVSGLELGESARVRDLEVPEGIEIINAASIPVVSVEIPRALRSAEAGEGEEGGGTTEEVAEE